MQLSRLLDAHQIIIREARTLARRASTLGDDGTNDLVVSDVLRTGELQVWFLREHLVSVPLTDAEKGGSGRRINSMCAERREVLCSNWQRSPEL